MIEEFTCAMEKAVYELYRWSVNTVQIFHHNDTDGLTSGAILTKSFERKGFRTSRICLEKPYPAVLKKVFKSEGKFFIFADFAGRIAPMISQLNNGRNLVFILDHHIAEPSTDLMVCNLDPDFFGLKGDRDISASVTCYRFAQILDPENRDLAYLAALGAVGDEFFVDGKLVSENRKAALDAVRQGSVKIEDREHGEGYIFHSSKGSISGESFSAYLDLLGGAGYYDGGPDVGVKVCLEGFSEKSDTMVDKLKSVKEKIFHDEIERLKGGWLTVTDHLQWFHVAHRFSPMGVKMIGAFCDTIKNMDFIYPEKYIAGFQIIPDAIPGFGSIELHEVKISMRVSALLEKKIRDGKVLGLNTFLPEATSRLGGFSDACHSLTAATTVAIGKEEQLIEEMEGILREQ